MHSRTSFQSSFVIEEIIFCFVLHGMSTVDRWNQLLKNKKIIYQSVNIASFDKIIQNRFNSVANFRFLTISINHKVIQTISSQNSKNKHRWTLSIQLISEFRRWNIKTNLKQQRKYRSHVRQKHQVYIYKFHRCYTTETNLNEMSTGKK